jgi:hypothetical protein
MLSISKSTSDDAIFGNLAQGHPSTGRLLGCRCSCPGFPNISTPDSQPDVDVEIQDIEIAIYWGGIKADLGDFSSVDISTDSIS